MRLQLNVFLCCPHPVQSNSKAYSDVCFNDTKVTIYHAIQNSIFAICSFYVSVFLRTGKSKNNSVTVVVKK
uniref:Uncharacterized protein n=1 Tax=Rhizophora mucronata TaxID=61149 RepID=A0A2P2PPK7_RHIMU